MIKIRSDRDYEEPTIKDRVHVVSFITGLLIGGMFLWVMTPHTGLPLCDTKEIDGHIYKLVK